MQADICQFKASMVYKAELLHRETHLEKQQQKSFLKKKLICLSIPAVKPQPGGTGSYFFLTYHSVLEVTEYKPDTSSFKKFTKKRNV